MQSPADSLRNVVVIGARLFESDQTQPPGGSGWVRRFQHIFTAHNPQTPITIHDCTADGHTLHDIRQRWDDDVGWHKPTTVIIILGVHDAQWMLENKSDHLTPEQFQTAFGELIAHHQTHFGPARFIFIDQPYMSVNDDPKWGTGAILGAISGYHTAIRRLADQVKALHIPAHQRLIGDLTSEGPLRHGGNETHPEQDAHVIIASMVADACGCAPTGITRLAQHQRIVCIGDSITDAGRRQPNLRPYGTGYVRLWRSLLCARKPELARTLSITNSGIGGNTILNLQNRWDRDCLADTPDHVTIKIGINDCNRTLSNNPEPMPAERYETILNELLTRSKASLPNASITLVSPFYLSQTINPFSYRKRVLDYLPRYIEALERASQTFDTSFINLHAIFHQHLQAQPSSTFGGNNGLDVVHPTEVGCMVIAEALYAKLQ